jgi:hypothetical protein
MKEHVSNLHIPFFCIYFYSFASLFLRLRVFPYFYMYQRIRRLAKEAQNDISSALGEGAAWGTCTKRTWQGGR